MTEEERQKELRRRRLEAYQEAKLAKDAIIEEKIKKGEMEIWDNPDRFE